MGQTLGAPQPLSGDWLPNGHATEHPERLAQPCDTVGLCPGGAVKTEPPYTVEQVLALPVTVDLMTTARVLGMSRTTAYELVRTGRYPVRLYKVGTRYRCLRSTLLEYLGIPDPLVQKDSR
jgi:excisionase family DNA binding protein